MIIKEGQAELQTLAGTMRTYRYEPVAGGRYPGIVLFSEIFQQTGPIKRTASFLAGHGYIVVVPEIFHELELPGSVLPYDQAGADRGNFCKINKTIASYDDDTRACVEYLQGLPHCTGKIGALGICIGGHLAFRAAMSPKVLASACFYATDIHKKSLGAGMNDNSIDRISEIKGELMMIWGRQDPHVPPEGRLLIYSKLQEAGIHLTWHEFNGAHAFLRDEGARYDPELASLSQHLVLSLFHRRLGEGDLNLLC